MLRRMLSETDVMTTFSTWESYFYPPPDDQTLRNIQDIRDPRALRVFEYGATALRSKQMDLDSSIVGRTYDADHVRAIHGYLFQDVYEWAGQFRTVNMCKNLSSFADVRNGEVDRYLADVHRLVTSADWLDMDRLGFARASAEVFAYLNQAHPFREGNGRTSKVFMEHVAEQSRFTFEFDRVSPGVWNQASMLSGPDLGRYEPVPDSLVPVFQTIAQPRTSVALTREQPSVERRGSTQERRSETRRCVGGEIERRLGLRSSRPEGGGAPHRGRGPR